MVLDTDISLKKANSYITMIFIIPNYKIGNRTQL